MMFRNVKHFTHKDSSGKEIHTWSVEFMLKGTDRHSNQQPSFIVYHFDGVPSVSENRMRWLRESTAYETYGVRSKTLIKQLVEAGVGDKTTPVTPEIHNLATYLPGMWSRVKYPCKGIEHCHPSDEYLFYAIQTLNDTCGWTREQIADWLDELQDKGGIDLTFKVDTDS